MHSPLLSRWLMVALLAIGSARPCRAAPGSFSVAVEEITTAPSVWKEPGVAFDEARKRAVIFGGNASATGFLPTGETWETEGDNLVFRSNHGPTPRVGPAMAFDGNLGKVLLFGGQSAGNISSETWAWDGESWQELHPSASPPPAFHPAMAFDRARGRVVLFCSNPAETWEWDGSSWQFKDANPSLQSSWTQLVYDPSLGKVLFFGSSFNGIPLKNTMAWDGASWSAVAKAEPSVLGEHTVAYDESRQRAVLAVGRDGTSQISKKVWEWDGSSWQTAPSLPAPDLGRLVWSGERMLYLQALSKAPFETLEYSGKSWKKRPLTSLQPRGRDAASFAVSSGRATLFGGLDQSTFLGDTWHLDGDTWSQQTDPSPPARAGAAAAPLVGGGILLVGGLSASALGDSWLFQQDTWQPLPASALPPRFGVALAPLAAEGTALLFGGQDGAAVFGDTWRWQGGWEQLSPEVSPSARAGGAMALDAARGEVVLFGGVDKLETLLNDTWVWDGASWHERQPLHTPPASSSRSLAFDPVSRTIVALLDDSLWSWDGQDWTPLDLPPQPRWRGGYLATDESRGELLLWEPKGRTFGLHAVGLPCSSDETCGAGRCVDGLCCEAQCGLCQACNLLGLEGRCAPLPAGIGDDGCSGKDACDGQGGCLRAPGIACQEASSCSTGACVDGACCFDDACTDECSSCAVGQHPGRCSKVFGRANPGRCEGNNECDPLGLCKLRLEQACGGDDRCASGRCALGRCVEKGARLCKDATTALLENGTEVSCGLYRCEKGLCVQPCHSSAQCAEGARCDEAGRCVNKDPVEGEAAGCEVRREGQGWGWALPLLALGLGLRRRRRQVAVALALLAPGAAQASPRVEVSLLSSALVSFGQEAITTDTVHQRVLMFGGAAPDGASATLWSWDGEGLLDLGPAGPSPRFAAGLAHDPQQDRLLLFGGFEGLSEKQLWQGDSWERKGDQWTPLSIKNSPAESQPAGLVWHPTLQRFLVVRFPFIFSLEDTTWTLLNPEASSDLSPPRTIPALAVDEGRGRLVLFGGLDPLTASPLGDLWEWDGKAWLQIPGAPLSPRGGAAAAYDPVHQRTVLCGGTTSPSTPGAELAECAGWDGSSWTELPPLPTAGALLPLAFDPRSGAVMSVMPRPVAPTGARVFLLREKDWEPVQDSRMISQRREPAAAYDPTTQSALLFGGALAVDGAYATPSDETWSWSGEWRRLSLDHAPSKRGAAHLAHDPVQQGILLFGGRTASGNPPTYTDDLWLFKDGGWTQLDPPGTRPDARVRATMKTDTDRNQIILFGGTIGLLDGNSKQFDDTWRWDGQAWAELQPEHRPHARFQAASAYDPGRKRLVIFGGSYHDQNTDVVLADTWEFDGQDWQQIASAGSTPPPRLAAYAYYDPDLRRVVMAGGSQAVTLDGSYSDVWSWDGARWELIAKEHPMLSSSSGAHWYDPVAHRLSITGGMQGPGSNPALQGTVALELRGVACDQGSPCGLGTCVDGVCCEQASCGPCQACDVPGAEGRCAPVPYGGVDTDSCEGACDGQGQCQGQPGQACQNDGDCLRGYCTDGVCCQEQICQGPCRTCAQPSSPGECAPVLDAPDPGSCDGAQVCDGKGACRLAPGEPCQRAEDCAGDICHEGTCRSSRPPFCDGDHKLYEGTTVTDCGAFRCTGEGTCRTSCVSTADCAEGYRCTEGARCVSAPQIEPASGCSAGAPGGSPLLLFLLLALATAHRRTSSPANQP